MITNTLVSEPTKLHKQLEALLLRFGGTDLVCLPDGRMQELIDKGVAMPGRVLMRRGKPNSCHENVGWLWANDPHGYKIATGYALSGDGLWRQHSWLVRSDGLIVETTVSRLLYFGFVLDMEDAARFAFYNLPEQRAEEIMETWREQALQAA